MMSAISWPSPDAEDEGPIDFSSKKPSVSDSPTDLSNNNNSSSNNSHRQSPVTESDGSTDETKSCLPDLTSKSGNGYKWKKAKTTCSSSSSSAQSSSPASTAAAAALAAYNLTTPSPSPPEATASSMSLLSTTLQHNSTTSEVLCRLLQGAVYGASQVGNGTPAAKLTSLPGLRDGMHHPAMDTSSTSENDDTLSPHRLDMNGSKASGSSTSSRKKGRPLPEELKDDAYWERRRKNNEAAKRSRDARRAKEYEVAIRATILEQENLKLRVEIASLKTELAKLRCLMYPAMQQQQQNQQSNQSNGNRKNRDSCCRHDHD